MALNFSMFCLQGNCMMHALFFSPRRADHRKTQPARPCSHNNMQTNIEQLMYSWIALFDTSNLLSIIDSIIVNFICMLQLAESDYISSYCLILLGRRMNMRRTERMIMKKPKAIKKRKESSSANKEKDDKSALSIVQADMPKYRTWSGNYNH